MTARRESIASTASCRSQTCVTFERKHPIALGAMERSLAAGGLALEDIWNENRGKSWFKRELSSCEGSRVCYLG
jgi:hypothetical protein